jgi:hypothetical protein
MKILRMHRSVRAPSNYVGAMLHDWLSTRFSINLIVCVISLPSEGSRYLSLLPRYQRAPGIPALSSP